MPERRTKAEPIPADRLAVDVGYIKAQALFLRGYAENRHALRDGPVTDTCTRILDAVERIEEQLEGG